jgi:hypothetical protein
MPPAVIDTVTVSAAASFDEKGLPKTSRRFAGIADCPWAIATPAARGRRTI